jgi:transcription elongation GreA/GreB family factor
MMADVNLVFKTLAKPVRGSYIKANKELRKLMFDDEEFQRFLLHEGEEDAVASLVSCIRHVVLLDSGDQQSLLVRIVRLYPELKHLVETRQTTRSQTSAEQRITSLRSFELRRRELDEVISVKIPANSRAIAHARGYGDLRENAEFKAAKEEQRLLRIRRAELERAIHEVQSFDFTASAPSGQVVPGCVVTLRLPEQRTETYTLLGLWDGDVEKRYISYESPLGQALVGKREGEAVELPGKGNAVVEKVEALPAELHHWLRGEDLL